MNFKFLSSGDTIYLVAPSFGAASFPYKERLIKSIDFLKKQNFKIIEGENIWLDEGIMGSNTPLKRAEEIEKAFKSDADFIWSVGGGETMNEILPYLNLSEIRKHPKLFMGYSDNTNLSYILQTFLNFKTIYGPCAGTFYYEDNSLYFKQKLDVLYGKKHFHGYPQYQSQYASPDPLGNLIYDTPKKITAINYTKPFSGKLLGGCLDCLISLCGTKFDKTKEYFKSQNDIIFFFESCDLNVLSYRRAIFQLKEAGWFDNINGLIVGRPMHIGENIGNLSFNKSLEDFLKDLNIPILLDVDIGHLPPTIPLITNTPCKISFTDDDIYIDYL